MQGKAIIVCAPSGAGKTTIVRHLVENIPELKFSISATTRNPRPNELDGKDYYFLTRKEFESKVENGDILEWQEVYENAFYGTLKSEVERIWEAGQHIIFDVEVLGGMNLKKTMGENALSIFIKVDDINILRKRLESRKTESSDSLDRRVQRAVMEMNEENKFDKVIVNHDLETALAEAREIVGNFIK